MDKYVVKYGLDFIDLFGYAATLLWVLRPNW